MEISSTNPKITVTNDCKGLLDKEGSCEIVVNYSSSQTEKGTSHINIIGNYTDTQGVVQQYISIIAVNYETNSAANVLKFNKKVTDFNILADGQETASTKVTLSKTTDDDSPIKIENISSPNLIDGLSFTGCKGQTLTKNSCELTIKFGPTTQTVSDSDVKILVKSSNGGHNLADFSSDPFWVLARDGSSGLAKIITEITPEENLSGDGTSTSPYISALDKPVKIKYTFTNVGTASAEQFLIDFKNLPFGAKVLGGEDAENPLTCLNSGEPLDAEASCEATIEAPSRSIFNVPAHADATTDTTQGTITIPPLAYSYQELHDEHTDSLLKIFDTSNPINVKFDRNFAQNINISNNVSGNQQNGWEATLIATVPANIQGLQFPIQVSAAINGSGFNGNLGSCSIGSAGGRCNLDIDFANNHTSGKKKVQITFKDRANNEVIRSHEITLAK